MTLRWYLSTAPSTVVDITDRVRWPTIDIGAKANQDGWSGDLLIDDPAGDLVPLMFRRIYAIEDEAPAGAQNVGNWFIANLKMKRTLAPVLASRIWTVTMADENSLLGRSVFDGSDANRPEETDIARLRWFLTTTEGNFFSANEDYIDTTGAKTMDAFDLRQSTPIDMLTAMMAASGKTYWVMYREDLAAYVIWYANPNTSALYASTLSLSNVLSEVGDPASTLVYALSGDAELDRAGGRMAYKLLAPYRKGFVTSANPAFLSTYGKVDRVAPAPEVTTTARAQAQVDRQLQELAVPDDEITTTWTAPASKVNLIKRGMIVPVHATHFANYTDDTDPAAPGYLKPGWAAGFVNCRVMEEAIKQVGGATITKVLKLSPMAESVAAAGILYLDNQLTTAGVTNWWYSGDDPGPGWLNAPTYGPLTKIGSPHTGGVGGYYTGFTVGGTGTVDMRYVGSVSLLTNCTLHWEIRVNGVAVASDSKVHTGTSDSWDLSVTGVAVVPADVLECYVYTSSPSALYGQPAGTGQGEYFQVSGNLTP